VSYNYFDLDLDLRKRKEQGQDHSTYKNKNKAFFQLTYYCHGNIRDTYFVGDDFTSLMLICICFRNVLWIYSM